MAKRSKSRKVTAAPHPRAKQTMIGVKLNEVTSCMRAERNADMQPEQHTCPHFSSATSFVISSSGSTSQKQIEHSWNDSVESAAGAAGDSMRAVKSSEIEEAPSRWMGVKSRRINSVSPRLRARMSGES